MRVGILLQPILNSIDGMNIACDNYIKALLHASAVSQVSFIVPDANQSFAEKYLAIAPSKTTVTCASQLKSAFKDNPVDFLLGLDPELGHSLALLRNQYASHPIPVLALIHTLSSPVTREVFRQITSAFQSYDAIIATSSSGKKLVANIMKLVKKIDRKACYHGKIYTIPLGVDEQFFIPQKKKKARAQLGWPQKPFIFGIISRLSAFSKMELSTHLIAFHEFLKQCPLDAQLFFIGKNESDTYIKKLRYEAAQLQIEDKIRFITDFDRDQAPILYQGIDVFLSFSDHIQETFGQSVIEAMSCGKPVIISDWNGYKDLISHQTNGYKVPVYWAECLTQLDQNIMQPLHSMGYLYDRYYTQVQSVAVDLEKAVGYMKALTDPQRRIRIEKNARKTVLKKFTWETIIESLIQTVQECLSQAQKIQFKNKAIPSGFPIYPLFRHYATADILPTNCFYISERGQALLNGRLQLIELQYVWAHQFNKPNCTQPILKYLKTAHTVKEILHYFRDTPSEDILFNVLYLLKYYLIIKCK